MVFKSGGTSIRCRFSRCYKMKLAPTDPSTPSLLPELLKFGPASRLFLFVPLPDSPTHFFVAVMTQATFRFALLTVRQVIEAGLRWLVIDEIGWLDDEKLLAAKRAKDGEVQVLGKRKFEDGVEGGRAAVETRKKRNR